MPSMNMDPQTTILLAESSPLQQANVAEILTDFQLPNLTIVDDGYELLEAVSQKSFDLILLDNGLLKANPFNLLSQLRSGEKGVRAPIFFTYEEDPAEAPKAENLARDAIAAGATMALRKPLAPEVLRKKIEETFGRFIVTVTDTKARSAQSLQTTEKAVALAKALKDSGKFKEAEDAYLNAIREIFFGLAEVYLYKGEKTACEELLHEASLIDPEAVEKFRRRESEFQKLGMDALKEKDYRRAKKEFDITLMLNENNASALAGLAEAHLGLDDRDSARENLLQVVSRPPASEHRFAYKHAGGLASRIKEYDIAVKAFELATTYIQGDPVLFYQQSLVHIARLQMKEALTCINKALILRTDFTEAQRVRSKIIEWQRNEENKEQNVTTA